MSARLLIGDVFERMAELPDGSVDLVLTSPPFLALRSYLPADHPDKAKEIGSEPTPAAFLDTLLRLTAEWRRLLAPHGSICVELGDTYSGSGGAGGDYNEGGMRDLQPRFAGSGSKHRMESAKPGTNSRLAAGDGWPLAKSLCGIPHLYHLSLAYGRNLLTGQPSPAGQWRVRNVVAWCRPNPPVGALGDKFRPATSYLTIACVSGQRYFDLDAVRGPYSPNTNARVAKGVESMERTGKSGAADRGGNWGSMPERNDDGAGAPPLDWWEIPTQPYPGAHYATWPAALCTRPILAMCPQRVCTICGAPSRRITEVTQSVVTHGHYWDRDEPGQRLESKVGNWKGRRQEDADRNEKPSHHQGFVRHSETLGWTDCGHDTWRNGLVLDPFVGSGTTLAVATGHGRDAIGIDLDERNADLCAARVGMFLEVDGDEEPRPVESVPLDP